MKIRLHIERLVVDAGAFETADAPQLQAAVAEQLRDLIATGECDWSQARAFASAHARAPAIEWPAERNIRAAGQNVARALYVALAAGVKP